MYTNYYKHCECLFASYFMFLSYVIFNFLNFLNYYFLELMWDCKEGFNMLFMQIKLGLEWAIFKRIGIQSFLYASIFMPRKLHYKLLLLLHFKIHLYIDSYCHHIL